MTHPDGTTITYDEIGNPLTYGGDTFSWEGRRLTQAILSDNTSLTMRYDASGLRTSKVINGGFSTSDSIQYIYQNSLIVAEIHSEYALYFTYDEQGKPFTLSYEDSDGILSHYYYYVSYLGDVLGLLNTEGELVGSYQYDGWGNLFNERDLTSIATKNPLRYRSYYYDTKCGRGLHWCDFSVTNRMACRFTKRNSANQWILGSCGAFWW